MIMDEKNTEFLSKAILLSSKKTSFFFFKCTIEVSVGDKNISTSMQKKGINCNFF